ncbi:MULTISPECIES: hypothetical protein [Priestia]|uniref:hypothetical protein n=1 Tax=Priestia TaxID=2800373 RepID=UPI001CD5778C|nr:MULTISPECIES: hypothetical protein [Priestia]MED4051130.1 hypothetical protein [Priestia megaterium]MED4060695.1 hypothetical protein [Priestia megaterium]
MINCTDTIILKRIINKEVTITPVIITNSSAYREVIVEDVETSGLNQTLFTVVK